MVQNGLSREGGWLCLLCLQLLASCCKTLQRSRQPDCLIGRHPIIIMSLLRRGLSGRGAALLCGGSSLSLYAYTTSRPALCDAIKPPPADAPKAAPSLEKRCLAEAIGTAIIVQGGCGCVCALKYAGASYGQFGLAAIWGASVALAAYSTRAVSGAHLNPAVTAALVANELFPQEEAPMYMAAQLVGATVAGAVNYAVFASGIASRLTQRPHPPLHMRDALF